jgi:23S rRNA (pseudouridine1915-N3)-methyltransferase
VRVALLAVGRLRAGSEAALVAAWLGRFDNAGRTLGLGPSRVIEVEDRRGRGRDAEAALLLEVAPDGPLVALDERGARPTSPEFAALLARLRDGGAREASFAIGGADGHGPALIARAAHVVSFGAMVWPHALARAMLAEQLYRAATILGGGPYHRG